MNFTFINTRILPGGSTVVKTDNDSIYLGSNINVAVFIFFNEGKYFFDGFTLDEVSNINKIVSNFNKHKKYVDNYKTREFVFKNVDSMLIPHKVKFNINEDINLFIKEVEDFNEIEKINVSYSNDALTLIGNKRIYGLSYDECFVEFIEGIKYPINESLLKKQSATIKVFDIYKYNENINKKRGKRIKKTL